MFRKTAKRAAAAASQRQRLAQVRLVAGFRHWRSIARVTVLALMSALCVGCSQSSAQLPERSREDEDRAIQAMSGPLTPYSLRPEESAAIEFAADTLVKECMAKQGFDFWVRPFSVTVKKVRAQAAQQWDRLFGITDASAAATYGYVPPWIAAGDDDEGQPAYRDSSEAFMVAMIGGNSPEFAVHPKGCRGDAYAQLHFTPETVPSDMVGAGPGNPGDLAEALFFKSNDEFMASSQWSAITADWVGCMAPKGWHVTAPLDDQGDINAISAARHEPTDPISDREKKLAQDDVACKVTTDLVARAKAANDAYDQKEVDQNLTALQESRTHLDEVVALANAVVERAK